MTFDPLPLGILVLGALLGGIANGLTGFGTALTALPIWLQVMPPPIAAALAAGAGVLGQVQSLHLVWHAVRWKRVAPFIVAGLAGVPIGTWLLPMIDLRIFKLLVGGLLVVFCAFQLSAERLARSGLAAAGGWPADALVGLGGGVMSGIAGLSGPLPIMWATFKPWSRDEKRALFQTFNLTILATTVASSTVAGLLPTSYWFALLICMPATYTGVWIGGAIYRRLDDRRFDRVVTAMLLTMGAGLIASSW